MISDVDAFRAAWNAASAVVVGERSDTKVLNALDRLAEGVVSRVAHGSTVEASLKPYLAVVKPGISTSDSGSLDAAVFRDGDRWLIDVRMGFASSVSAFNKVGKRLSLPPNLRWSYRQFGPFFRTGKLLAFDSTSLSDAGVRYGYRLAFLRRTGQGYVSAGVAEGFWNYEDSAESYLSAQTGWVTLMTLESPRAFFVSNAERLLRRRTSWDTQSSTARRVSSMPLDPDVRAADDWLATHIGSRLSKSFVVQKDNGMADNVRRGKGWVEIGLDSIVLRFDLVLVGKKNVVRKVTVR